MEKSWSKFKIHFYLAHKEMSETKQHQQNQDLERKTNPMSKKKPKALMNLAYATEADRKTVAELIATNTKITAELIKNNQLLTLALE